MSRWVATAAVVALFLSGISIGALGFVVYQHHWRPGMTMLRSPVQPPDVMMDHLDAELVLTVEQRRRIEAILDDAERRSDEIRREIRPRLEAQIDETHRRIGEVLTAEQRLKFEELTREMHRHSDHFFLGEHMRARPHGVPPDGRSPDRPSPEK